MQTERAWRCARNAPKAAGCFWLAGGFRVQGLGFRSRRPVQKGLGFRGFQGFESSRFESSDS